MIMTSQYDCNMMSKYYLIHAGVNQFVWFDNYKDALSFMLSGNIDPRFIQEITTPAN